MPAEERHSMRQKADVELAKERMIAAEAEMILVERILSMWRWLKDSV
jgi:hypothetical protein